MFRLIASVAASKFHGQVRFTDEVKDVDFLIMHIAVGIFVACNSGEENMKARRKVATMRRYTNDQVIGIVIVRRLRNDAENFIRLQQFATINFGFKTVSVTQAEQAANFVLTMASPLHAEMLCKPTSLPTDVDLAKPLEELPEVGPVKARNLLQHFGTIERICTGSVEELAEVVGAKAAEEVKEFISSTSRTSSETAGNSPQI
ncbi:HHH 2 domain containing protein [Trichuris trichiura]|uniref:HHH 2 domain containing protein n=1 Tax=Trichuris trichiura TaxID=36087 RepID=A0A077ZES2_TRITR|nr:HHH 2 domain containing protein [Trichuris trichiura]